MRFLTASVVLLAACGNVSKPDDPTSATPAATPSPTPVPQPSTPPPPTYTPPPANTPLADVPASEWPDLCDAVAQAIPADTLFCDEFEFEVPATSKSEMVGFCVQDFGGSAQVGGCIATVADLTDYFALDIDCDYFFDPPPVVDAVATCIQDVTPPTPTTCEVVSNLSPADGSTGVFVDTPVTVDVTGVDPTFDIDVTQGGTPVAGSGSFSGNTFVWTPAVPLMPSTTYVVDATWCSGQQTFSTDFTTSAIGSPTDTFSLVDTTYEIDLSDPGVVWVQPAGVGALLGSQLDGIPLLMGVQNATASNLEVIVAIGAEGSNPPVQDECSETTTSSTDFASNPFFDDLELSFPLLGVPFGPLPLSGAFSPDGSTAVLSLQGSIDTRPLVPLLAPGGADDEICNLMLAFGVNCVTCPTGGDFCLPMHIENLVAEELPSTVLVEVDANDIANNPNCPF